MGLNWAAGLTATGEGLEGLQAAKEKTMELEYRNTRDANMRRFTLEDQAREDKIRLEGEARTDAETARTEGRTDDALFDTGTDRSEKIRTRADEDSALKHSRMMDRALAVSRNKSPMAKTEEDWVRQGFTKWLEKYQEEVEASAPQMDEEGNPRDFLMPPYADVAKVIGGLRSQWAQMDIEDSPFKSGDSVDAEEESERTQQEEDELREMIKQIQGEDL